MNRSIHIKAVIFDWAGTAVDYGCFAPVRALEAVFDNNGISLMVDEARQPMEALNIDYIRAICKIDRIAALWHEKHGQPMTERDIELLFLEFGQIMLAILPSHSDLIPGVKEMISALREKGIKIGSTTHYTKAMMDIISAEAKKKGYTPDCIVTPEDAPAGRPYPWMCYMNAIKLGIYPLETIAKVGNTIFDVKEGLNAGMWSIAIIKGSRELGLNHSEVKRMNKKLLKMKLAATYDRFKSAGAHYVIKDVSDLFKVIEHINERLKKGEIPNGKRYRFS